MTLKLPAFVASTLLCAATLASPAFASGTTQQLPAGPSYSLVAEEREVPAPATTKASGDDASRYAEREITAKKQADYKGGSVLVISLSTGAVILIVILVLLLV